MKKRIPGKARSVNENWLNKPSWKNGTGSFTFHNGDTYVGEYKLDSRRRILARQGRGTYKTSDLNEYTGTWNIDVYEDSEFHIHFNNGEEYKGKINQCGMNGPGWYKFPDGSSIEALWQQNRPIENIVYKERSGFPYFVEKLSENEIIFAPSNHFWAEGANINQENAFCRIQEQEEEDKK